MTPNLAVVILNYRRPKDTLACAEIVLKDTPAPLVIVDNDSGDNSPDLILKWGTGIEGFYQFKCGGFEDSATLASLHKSAKVLFIKSPRNGGYAFGNNLGISAALSLGADYVWILNNDAFPAADAMLQIKEMLASQPNKHIGLWGTTVLQGDSEIIQCVGGGHTNPWSGLTQQLGHGMTLDKAARVSTKDLNYICGASVIASRHFIEETGLLDEDFFLYCEEQDWAIRGTKKGFSMGIIPKAIVHHFEGSSTGMNEANRPAHRMARLAISRIRLAAKHQPLAVPTVFIGLVFALSRMYLKRLMPGGSSHNQ